MVISWSHFQRELNQLVYRTWIPARPISVPGMFPKQNFVNMRQGLAIENPALRDEDKVRQDRDPELKNRLWAAFVNSEYSRRHVYPQVHRRLFQRYWFDTTTDADASAAEDSGVDWTRIMLFFRRYPFPIPPDIRHNAGGHDLSWSTRKPPSIPTNCSTPRSGTAITRCWPDFITITAMKSRS